MSRSIAGAIGEGRVRQAGPGSVKGAGAEARGPSPALRTRGMLRCRLPRPGWGRGRCRRVPPAGRRGLRGMVEKIQVPPPQRSPRRAGGPPPPASVLRLDPK